MKKHLFTLLLAALLLSTGCGNTPSETETTTGTDAVGETTPVETEWVYPFANNYGGEDFHIQNVHDAYGMHSDLDREETTGEALNDAMYNRCRKLEEKLGIVLVEEFSEYGNGGTTITNTQRNLVAAGDDLYDVMYICAEQNAQALGIEGCLMDLLSFDSLMLDKDWWFSATNDKALYDGKLFSAVGASHLMHLDSIWCLYFNEDMMDKLSLDYPYDMVREGSWTLDRLDEYLSAAASLNGDVSFEFNKNGNAVYGLSINNSSRILYGTGEYMLDVVDGEFQMTAGTDRFYRAAEAIIELTRGEDGTTYRMINGVGDDQPGSYMHTFMTERSLFLGAEVSKTSMMRDMEFSFGIVPYPKLEESQSQYYVSGGMAMNFAIPVTCTDGERAAVVGDALTYLSYQDVMPVWRNVTLEQKGLRNEDSVEMLEIIVDSNTVQPFTLFGIGSDFVNTISGVLFRREDTLASAIAANTEKIEAEIAAMGK